MSTTVYPPLPAHELAKQVQATTDRELQWLLKSLQDTFASLKSGLNECDVLLAPVEPGATLVVSSLRSETVKGLITRVGTRLVKGDISLRLATLPPPPRAQTYPLRLSASDSTPYLILSQLSTTRNLINQALDVVDISTWTGDAHDANFIAGQLKLLEDLIKEAKAALKGDDEQPNRWYEEPLDENLFDPPLPPTLSLSLLIRDASIMLYFRTLHVINSATPTSFSADALSGLSLRQRLGLAAKLPEHDESDVAFTYRGQEVRVREKVKVESQDPSLMAVMAKLSALEHAVGIARRSLGVVRGEIEEDES